MVIFAGPGIPEFRCGFLAGFALAGTQCTKQNRYIFENRTMKKLINLTFALFILTASLYGQNKIKCVGVNDEFNEKDTTHTFTMDSENIDSIRHKLFTYWGTPTMIQYGNVKWKNIEIPNLGNNLEVELFDWICTHKEKSMRCRVLKSEKQKEKQVKNLKQNQNRWILVTIKSKEGINIINSKLKAKQVAQILEDICAK